MSNSIIDDDFEKKMVTFGKFLININNSNNLLFNYFSINIIKTF